MSVENAGGLPPSGDKAFHEFMKKLRGAEGKMPTNVRDVYTELLGDPGNMTTGEIMSRILDTYSDEEFFDYIFTIIGPISLKEIMEGDGNDDIENDWEKLRKKLRNEGLRGEDDTDPNP